MSQEKPPLVRVYSNAEALALGARDWLVAIITEHLASDSTRPFVLSLSGGSTPKRLYQLLAELPPETIDWNRVILVWGDERNVPQDHADSNFRMVKEAMLDRISIPAENILGVPAPGSDASDAAKRYETLLNERIPEGIDAVLLGIGDDVHTASLFPGTEALSESKRAVVSNWVDKLNCWRITLSAPYINQAKHTAFLIAGPAKEPALNSLWHADYNPQEYPSQLIRPESGKLLFLLDEAALGSLTPPVGSQLEFVSEA